MSLKSTLLSGLRPHSGDLLLSEFQRCVWLSPALFAVHALEDAPGLAEWMRAIPMFEPVSREQLIVALSLLDALCCVSAFMAHRGTKWGVFVFLWMQGFVFLHGVAHLIPSLSVAGYTPGLVTGVLLLPVSYFLYRRARRYCPFGRWTAALLLALAVLLYDPVLRLAFKAGDAVTNQPTPGYEEATPAMYRKGVL